MQLSPDHGTVEAALEELKIKLPIAALSNIIDRRVAQHKTRGELRRRLEALKALQEEARG